MLSLSVFCLYLAGVSAFVLPTPVKQTSGRIIGGDEASIEDHPYSASLEEGFSVSYIHVCGASILSKNYLLSAAQCIVNPSIIIRMFARIGTADIAQFGQRIEVIKFTQHPLYNEARLEYDVAVLTLARSIQFGPNAMPVVLPSSSLFEPKENDIVTASGWGFTSTSSIMLSNILHKVDLPTWDNEKCKSVYSFITPRHICFGGTPVGGTATCYGDNGGPITFNGVQVALVSGVDNCSAPNIPGIYARILPVVDWIQKEAELD